MEEPKNLSEIEYGEPKNPPYTRGLDMTPYNGEKVRDIVCIHCKYKMRSNVIAPICGVCNHEMLTVVK